MTRRLSAPRSVAMVAASMLLAASGRGADATGSAIDLGAATEIGGLTIDWPEGEFASDYVIEGSDDGTSWHLLRRVEGANGGRDFVFLGRVATRAVRLVPERGAKQAVPHLRAVPSAEFATPSDFFAAVAKSATRGAYPKYLLQEQTYWTAVGVEGDTRKALVNEEGMLEVGERTFSVEPFLQVDDRFVPWSFAKQEQSLLGGDLPIPIVTWRAEPVTLTETAFAAGSPGESVLYATYRVANVGDTPHRVTLFLGLRPFQVNPPWQSLTNPGGVTPIHHLRREGNVVWVNGATALVALTEPNGFGAARFEQGSLTEFLHEGRLPPESQVFDALGFASGALRWDFALDPGASSEVVIAVPFHDPQPLLAALPRSEDASAFAAAQLDATASAWRARLAGAEIRLPPEAGKFAAALRSAVAQILVARAGPALRPGTRTYARSWIRDGALMDAALLQMGITDAPRDFVHWFASFQEADGRVPCCVDWRGGDSAPEHDSPGELIYGIVSLFRADRDGAQLRALWPNVVRAVAYLESLRSQRLGPEWRTPEKREFYGLLPESISHEGYAKHPVHSYWDDYWALRGLSDAVFAAQALGETADAARFAKLRDSFRDDLRASIAATMEKHRLETVPASADLADFDPSATAIAIAPGGEQSLLPEAALARTYDRYMEDFRKRRAGEIAWEAYTPYELRNAEALIHLGRRDDALAVLGAILADQRPAGWNQWGEIVWRDPTAPRFIGDEPHGWIAAGFVRAAISLFAYEREDGALVLAAGVPLEWARAPTGVAVARLRTSYGPLSYTIAPAGERSLSVAIAAGIEVPARGIVVRSPGAPLRAARVDGRPARERSADSVTVRALPASIVFEY